MNLLFVSRSNTGTPHPFVQEQADNLISLFNLHINHFLIARGGLIGYMKALLQLKQYLKHHETDIIHVHYGLWAPIVLVYKAIFLANYKVIITFHGSDINKPLERQISVFSSRLAAHNILVSAKMCGYIKKNYSVIPCGVDVGIRSGLREITRKHNNWNEDDFVILFSSNFNREVKDPAFAFKVVEEFCKETTRPVRFIELKGYSREQLTGLMQAADVMILCSISEGSPQVVKESILNTLPIIANDVGDIRAICSGVDHCFIVRKEVEEYVKYLKLLSCSRARIGNNAPVIDNYNNTTIATRIYSVYNKVVS